MPVFRKDGRAILFVHVPKAGGSAVERVFAKSGYKMHYRDPKVAGPSVNSLRRCSPQHMHREMLEMLFDMSRFDVVFMTVRDPVARFRSEFAMRNRSIDVADAATVEAWFDQVSTRYLENPFVHDNHLRPQTEFHLPGCHVYQLEQGLERALSDLDQRHGLDLETTVPRVMDSNEAGGVPSSEVEVSASVRERLGAWYHDDFVRFGY